MPYFKITSLKNSSHSLILWRHLKKTQIKRSRYSIDFLWKFFHQYRLKFDRGALRIRLHLLNDWNSYLISKVNHTNKVLAYIVKNYFLVDLYSNSLKKYKKNYKILKKEFFLNNILAFNIKNEILFSLVIAPLLKV